MTLLYYEQCMAVLKLLELHTWFPKKITRKKVLTVSDKITSRTELKQLNQLPWFMLESLVTCNYEGMSFVLDNEPNVQNSDNSLSCFLEEKSTTSTTPDPVQIHPLDVLTALFLCCDDFLRQTLVENLSKCQLGIPLLLPVIDAAPQTSGTEMLCWATSTLRKKWKTSSGPSLEQSMAVHRLPILSALRVGRPRISKSKILNQIISKHDHFFHSECEGETAKKVISNGVLELIWYLPMGNDGDKFPNAFGIMNLRGNAHDLSIQKRFVTEVSSITILFCQSDMSKKDEMDVITSWNNQNSHLILVFDGTPIEEWKPTLRSAKSAYNGGKTLRYIVKEGNKNLVQSIRDDIKKCMSTTFPKQNTPKSLEDCETIAINAEPPIRIDHKFNVDNYGAKLKVNELLKGFKADNKGTFLPLQSKSSCIALKEREMLNMKKRDIQPEMYLETVDSDITDLRKHQWKLWTKTDLTMIKRFTDSFTLPTLGRSYLYNWMGTMLDRYSIPLQNGREESRCDMPRDQVLSESGMSATADFESFEQAPVNSSLGLENVNREIAQVYETASYLNKMSDDVQQYPEIAAEMMFDGQSLEIMDGDATYVPVTWLKAVFTCLRKNLGNAKIFVLSILGLQSSGKSTMLNTMFGLKFAVGSGRCTKGAFVQLVPLQKNASNFKYILVVDTEGLRAPEIASIQHSNRDNEMATFVIGLGDATVINVMGENQTDIQDILQIVVYALMKMKSINLKPSCIFVHQNVSDLLTSESSRTQRITLKKLLDQTTKISAEAQRVTVNSFADVIKFNEEKHVAHISSLWQGDPPMAPPNPGYVRCVLELRKMIFGLMEEDHGNTINEIKNKLTDLWKAVQCEDFAFSFKNTLEIQAYARLETEYIRVSRDFRQACMRNGKALVRACKIPKKDMEAAGKNIFKDHQSNMQKSYDTFSNDMDKYFQINRAAHWEAEINNKMSMLNTEMTSALQEEFRIAKQTVSWKSKRYEQGIHMKFHELADKFKDCGKSKLELENQFNEIWNEWIENIPELDNIIDTTAPSDKLKGILLNAFTKERNLIQYLLKNENGLDGIVLTANDIVKPFKWAGLQKITEAELRNVNSVILQGRDKSIRLIESHRRNGSSCNEHILKEVVDALVEFLNHPPKGTCVSFTHAGIAKNTFCILWKLLPEFEALQEAFNEQNDPKLYMISQKEKLLQIFLNECAMVKGALTTALKWSIPLSNAINEAIKESFIGIVIDYFMDYTTLSSKKIFHAKMLIDLAEKNSFELANGYLLNPSYRMSCWLQEYILNALQVKSNDRIGRTVLENLYLKCIDEKYKQAKETTNDACKHTGPTCEINDVWQQIIRDFDAMTIEDSIPHNHSENCDIQVEDLQRELANELDKEKKSLTKKLDTSSEDILKYTIPPVVKFFEKDLIGCEEPCPFCNAPCDNLAGCTRHQTQCHRPQGFGGYRRDKKWYTPKQRLPAELCTTTVSGNRNFRYTVDEECHPLREYRDNVDRSWNISPIADPNTQLYWKWFMAKYNKQLAKFYECDKADIPSSWKKIEWKSVKEDMVDLYDLPTDEQATVLIH